VNEGSADWVEGPGLAESMWRQRRLVAAVVALATMTALGYALLLQPTRYEGVAQVYLPTSTTKQSDDPSRVVRAQAEVLGSPTVLDRAAEDAGGGLTRQTLEERVTVEPASDADLITVSVREATPERAAEVADSVVLAYTDLLAEEARSSAARTADALQAAENRLTTRLDALTAELAADPGNPALQAKIEARQSELEDVAEEAEATELAAARADEDAPGVQTAVVPDEPVQPRPLRTGALGLLGGLMLAALLAWWREGRARLGPAPVAAQPAPTLGGSAPAVTLEETTEGPDPAPRPVLPRLERLQGDSADAGEAEVSRLTSSLQQVVDSLESASDGAYHPDAPQFVADQVAALPDVDEVVVLLDEGQGLRVSGRVGLGEAAGRGHERDDQDLLDSLSEAGPHLVADGERSRLVRAGIPGGTAQTVVCVPLLHDENASAVVLAGRRGPHGAGADGTGSPEGAEDETAQADLARVARRAQQLVPHLRAWVLMRRMTQRLDTLDPADTPGPPAPEQSSTERG
jgi:capsular polysaccharide biosynthesis protein